MLNNLSHFSGTKEKGRKHKLALNKADLYVGIYILYQLQNILYPAGLINQVLLLIFFIFSIVVGIKYILPFKNKSFLLISTSLLLWMFILYGAAFIISPTQYEAKGTPIYFYLLNSLISLMPILVFYDFLKRGIIFPNRLVYYLLPFIILYILHFYRLQNFSMINSADDGLFREEFTNNTGYSFLSLLPLTLLLKNRLVKYFCMVVLVLFIFSAYKRGAILITAIILMIVVINDLKNIKNLSSLVSSFLLFIVASFFVVNYISNKYETSDYLQSRVEETEEGDTSNRDVIYEKVLDSYLEGNLLQILLGRGADSTMGAANTYAHQDWLETLHNNGLLGGILLFLFYLSIFKGIKRLKNKISDRVNISLWSLFLICFLKSFFSMSIQDMELGLSMMLGYLAFLDSQHELNKNDYDKSLYFEE